MPLPPDPRGSSVDTPQTDPQTDVSPAPQIQIPSPEPIHHPGCTAVAPSPTPTTPHHASVASNPTSEIQNPFCSLRALRALPGESSSPPHPTSDIPHPTSQPPALTDSASRELAKLKSQLHALASPDGFAPTRDEFARAIRRTSRPYCKFFKGYDEFIRSCGYKSAVDRLREINADQRAAAWAAARESTTSSTPPIASHVSHKSHMSHMSDTPHASNPPTAARSAVKPKPRTNEPFYGDPIHCCDMAHAPVNEQGVVLLFGILAKKLKYRIEMVRTGYPDCEAKRQGPDGKWRRVRIEFEFLSSRFNHDPAGCDLIVCWEDDANPTNLEVLELKNHVGTEPQSESTPQPQPEPAGTSITAPSAPKPTDS